MISNCFKLAIHKMYQLLGPEYDCSSLYCLGNDWQQDCEAGTRDELIKEGNGENPSGFKEGRHSSWQNFANLQGHRWEIEEAWGEG